MGCYSIPFGKTSSQQIRQTLQSSEDGGSQFTSQVQTHAQAVVILSRIAVEIFIFKNDNTEFDK